MIYINSFDNFFFSSSFLAKKTELAKAKDIASQLAHSIYWLELEANRKEDQQKKTDLRMEAEAARRELININRKIEKAENNNDQ